jgi:RNA polymerase sigma-70 factor (ECF subfamily)
LPVSLPLAEFDRLVTEHGPSLFRLAYRLVGDRQEAEDILQDTFRSAWKSRDTFLSGGSERAWLVSILRRRVADYWRRGKPPVALASDSQIDALSAPTDPLRNELTDEVQQALAQLPEELRETLLLVVVGELTHQEAADALNVPLGTVLSRVSRARKRLREYLLAIYANKKV